MTELREEELGSECDVETSRLSDGSPKNNDPE